MELLVAAASGDIRTIWDLKCDVQRVDNGGRSAVLCAASGGHADCIRALADLKCDMQHVDNTGRSTVLYAAHGGHLDCIRALVQCKANLTHTSNTALSIAARKHPHIVMLLLELKANIDGLAREGVADSVVLARSNSSILQEDAPIQIQALYNLVCTQRASPKLWQGLVIMCTCQRSICT